MSIREQTQTTMLSHEHVNLSIETIVQAEYR